MSKTRIEAFSDGVFAIAITLLVLTIAQPSDYSNLTHELTDRWPSLAAYVVSFIVIGIMWLNHHSVFASIAHVDRGLFFLNLLLLLTVVFIPYPTGVFGEAIRQGEGARVAAAAYSVAMTMNGVAWGALWLYASTKRRLLDPSFPESGRRRSTVLFVAGTGLYALSIPIALINAYGCLIYHALLAAYYALDPLSRSSGHTTIEPHGHDPLD